MSLIHSFELPVYLIICLIAFSSLLNSRIAEVRQYFIYPPEVFGIFYFQVSDHVRFRF